MTFNPDSDLQREVAGQPDDWAGVVARLPEVADALPAAGARVAVVGCGTSYFMAQAYAALREQAGHGETDAFAASEHRLDRGYDAVLVITRSGTTTEVIDVLARLRGRDVVTTAIVATPGTPVTELADRAILLPEVDEQSVVQTRFATSILALLRASLGEDLVGRDRRRPGRAGRGRGQCLAGLADAEQVTFVGRGWTVGLADGGGPQAARVGPVLDRVLPRDGVPPRPDQHRRPGPGDLGVRRGAEGWPSRCAATGAHFESRDIDPLAELVRVHRLCLAKARQGDLDPDHPRHLTRSVVLPSASL